MADNRSPSDPINAAPGSSSTRINDEKPPAAGEAMAGAGADDQATATHVEVSEPVEGSSKSRWKNYARSAREAFSAKAMLQSSAVLLKLARFFGPGSIISVGYIDPDNFQTALSAGAQFGFSLLFMILVSNLIAIYLQALAVKLGSVTGMDLAQMNRASLPPWLNIFLYLIAEAAIICTDIGQVIGTAIAINILIPQIPLVAGCALAMVDTLFILLFYDADGSLRKLRIFELFISAFVLGVFISFCIELSLISASVAAVFRGYLPSAEIFQSQGLYESCAILGGTLMPHTIYLGSGLVQARMRAFDRKNNRYQESAASDSKYAIMIYRPSLSAIKSCMSYSIAELCITLFIVSIFVNSAILIVSAAAFNDAEEADLPGMYALFVSTISQASGTVFALALLFSGIASGIIVTLAGQLVCEGALNWRMSPLMRRLLTRSLAIIPGIIIAGAEGQEGLTAALIGCNVVLSVSLIFLTFPLVLYTSSHRYMRVQLEDDAHPAPGDGVVAAAVAEVDDVASRDAPRTTSFANNWITTIVGWLIWLLIAGMNVATLVFIGQGVAGD